MENLPEKKPGKGAFAVRNWESIRKGGGLAPPLEEIEKMIVGGDDSVMLTREELEKVLIDYFSSKIATVQDEETGERLTVWKSAPTKSELCARLGISTRTLSRYLDGSYDAGRHIYQGLTRERISPCDFDLVRKAMLLISDFYEKKLHENRNVAGVIFWLLNSKNDRWSNEQKVEITKEQREPAISREEITRRAEMYSDLPGSVDELPD